MKRTRWADRELPIIERRIEGGTVLPASRLRILQGLMILATGGALGACHKDAPQKPAPVVVKKSPAEIKQLADSARQSLEGLKAPLAALNEKFAALHPQFDTLPQGLPDFAPTRAKFYGSDEGLGRMNAQLPWLSERIDAAVKAGDGAELEEISRSIARTLEEFPQVDQIAIELLHEVLPFKRMAAELEARQQAMCEADKAGLAATVAKKLSAH
jgi:hypothetical protein